MTDQRHEDVLVEHMDIGEDAMANKYETARGPAMNWPQVRSGPLIVGGILIGIGAMATIAGMAVAGKHLVDATREWANDLETPPDQLARLRWEQAKAAAFAGADAWRKHPNAQARLVRSGSSR
jgi:hypothetical protein